MDQARSPVGTTTKSRVLKSPERNFMSCHVWIFHHITSKVNYIFHKSVEVNLHALSMATSFQLHVLGIFRGDLNNRLSSLESNSERWGKEANTRSLRHYYTNQNSQLFQDHIWHRLDWFSIYTYTIELSAKQQRNAVVSTKFPNLLNVIPKEYSTTSWNGGHQWLKTSHRRV
jgi:hypothetical protein